MLTADEVRKELGLMPFEGFARKAEELPERERLSEMLSDPSTVLLGPRRTGRTTRMICTVLAAISSGRRVAIYSKPLAHEHVIKEKAQQMAEEIGLNPKLIVGHLATAELEFFDHTWYDS